MCGVRLSGERRAPAVVSVRARRRFSKSSALFAFGPNSISAIDRAKSRGRRACCAAGHRAENLKRACRRHHRAWQHGIVKQSPDPKRKWASCRRPGEVKYKSAAHEMALMSAALLSRLSGAVNKSNHSAVMVRRWRMKLMAKIILGKIRGR